MQNSLFEGLKVIDCATVIAAPAAAMILADFGAEVIKIEQHGDGDMLRMLSHIPTAPNAGSDWFWQMDGHNKKALCLNLKSVQGIEILHKLVAQCDVFITNHPADARESLGLTYEDLKPLNPNMIYASLTAYGEKGPERNRKGFDQLAYWARSGLMDLMRAPNTTPTQGLPGMGDHPTAVALYAAIVTGLLNREKTGKGGMVHTSLLANGIWSASGIAQGAMAGGDMPTFRANNLVTSAMMRPYQTSDGRWLQFNMVRNDELLSLLLAGLDAIHLLADPRFANVEDMFANRQALGDELQALVATQTSEHWLEIFTALNVPVNRVAKVEEAPFDRQIIENKIATKPEIDGVDIPLIIHHPIQVDAIITAPMTKAPDLGEHSEEILKQLGYSADAIKDLKHSGVI
jgi:formyl-CoA transferase